MIAPPYRPTPVAPDWLASGVTSMAEQGIGNIHEIIKLVSPKKTL